MSLFAVIDKARKEIAGPDKANSKRTSHLGCLVTASHLLFARS